MDDIMEIFKSLEKSGSLIKKHYRNNWIDAEVQKSWSLGMLLGALGASLFGNLLIGKVLKAKISWQEVMKAGKGANRASKDF